MMNTLAGISEAIPVRLVDLGRPITHSDILDERTYPILREEEGATCYVCEMHAGSSRALPGLTTSAGVFTARFLCAKKSPVFVCLEHAPFNERRFDAFAPEVAEQLRVLASATA